jgi:hypothetical protein
MENFIFVIVVGLELLLGTIWLLLILRSASHDGCSPNAGRKVTGQESSARGSGSRDGEAITH